MSTSTLDGGFGSGGGGLVIATTSTAAGIVIPQTNALSAIGILPQTGGSNVSVMAATAIITFAVMLLSHATMRAIRAHNLRRA